MKSEVKSNDVRNALDSTLRDITDAVQKCLENTPPELGADILENGIMLTGGGALLKNMDKAISQRVNIPVHQADDPLTAVVRGTGIVLENLPEFSSVLL